MTLEAAENAIYQSLDAGNEDIDLHIANLKAAMVDAGAKEFTADAGKLAQGNRAGRKMMQSYFKKRGVKVNFRG